MTATEQLCVCEVSDIQGHKRAGGLNVILLSCKGQRYGSRDWVKDRARTRNVDRDTRKCGVLLSSSHNNAGTKQQECSCLHKHGRGL